MASDVVSFIIFIRRSIGLIITPYTTMRKISIENRRDDIIWIGVLSCIYFLITNSVRFWGAGLFGALGLFIGTILFFSILPAPGLLQDKLKRMYKTWAYSLLPTLIWFYTTLLFYFVFPPPRTTSLLGQIFSVCYIAFSVSLLVWKVILVYLSIRFSLRVHLYRVIYYMLLYLSLSIPLWIYLYNNGISRIPFV